MKKAEKNIHNCGMLILMLLIGIVTGGLFGECIGQNSYMSWLKYGNEFGLTNPFIFDLGVIKFTFALSIKFTISTIIGILISIIIYKKL